MGKKDARLDVTVTVAQRRWVEERAEAGLSSRSQVIRDLIQAAMEREQPKVEEPTTP